MFHRPTKVAGYMSPQSGDLSQALSRGFLLVPHSPHLRYVAEVCAEALGGANALLDAAAYSWAIERPEDIGEHAAGCVLFLIGAPDLPWHAGASARPGLAVAMHRACHIALVGGAVFLQVLAGRRSPPRLAVPPDLRSGFAEAWPEAEIVPATISRDGRISSAIGSAAALRLIIQLITEADGTPVGRALRQRLGLEDAISAEMHSALAVAAAEDPLISRAVRLMGNHLEDTLSTVEVARRLDVSSRQLERRFRSLLGLTPLQAYRELRLERARDLLVQTSMPVEQIALASGFSHTSSLNKWLRQRYGEAPAVLRRRALRGSLV